MLFGISPSKASLILFLCKLDAELSRLGAELIQAFVWVVGLKLRPMCMLAGALPLIALRVTFSSIRLVTFESCQV